MTGVNLNVQNSYAALYSTSMAPTSAPKSNGVNTEANAAATTSVSGEKLTLSAEAIALSQQTSEPVNPPDDTTLVGGGGIRPPAAPVVDGDTAIPPQ